MLLTLVALALRIVQGCLFASLLMTWFHADPKHPAVEAVRAIAEPFIALARPIARKLPVPLEWTATTIAYLSIDILRRLIGG